MCGAFAGVADAPDRIVTVLAKKQGPILRHVFRGHDRVGLHPTVRVNI